MGFCFPFLRWLILLIRTPRSRLGGLHFNKITVSSVMFLLILGLLKSGAMIRVGVSSARDGEPFKYSPYQSPRQLRHRIGLAQVVLNTKQPGPRLWMRRRGTRRSANHRPPFHCKIKIPIKLAIHGKWLVKLN
jgi:hypothetical protein